MIPVLLRSTGTLLRTMPKSSCDRSILLFCSGWSTRAKTRTNNVLEHLNREVRRRTRVVGTFPDGQSALMLVCALLRHVTGTQWGVKRYMSMKPLEQMDRETMADPSEENLA